MNEQDLSERESVDLEKVVIGFFLSKYRLNAINIAQLANLNKIESLEPILKKLIERKAIRISLEQKRPESNTWYDKYYEWIIV